MSERKVAIVTAAAGAGIGAAIARQLAGDGMRVIITDLHEGRMVKLSEELSAVIGEECPWRRLDVSDHAAVETVFDEVAARYGRIDMMASMAKLFVTEATMQITQDAMRVLGGYGYVAEFPIERLYREAPIYVLTEGSNEIQRIIIAREMIKADGPERLGLV